MKGEVVHLRAVRPERGIPKSAPYVPNLQEVRDLCCGLCRTWTRGKAATLGEDLPVQLVEELSGAVRRSGAGGQEVEVTPLSSRWLVSFDTRDGEETYSFSFGIAPRWLGIESSRSE